MHARKRVIRLVNSERGTFVIGADNVPALPAEERKDTRGVGGDKVEPYSFSLRQAWPRLKAGKRLTIPFWRCSLAGSSA